MIYMPFLGRVFRTLFRALLLVAFEHNSVSFAEPHSATTSREMSCRLKSSKRKIVRASLPQVCASCGATELLTLDHIIPLVYGGTNERSNLQILCLSCNRLKSRREIRHWNAKKNTIKGQTLAVALNSQSLR